MIDRAKSFATEAHEDQMYGAHPYLVHLDAVAALARDYGEVAEVVAYLHDVVEDTEVGLDLIEGEFGRLVADCVSILTDESGESREERKRKTYAKMAEVSGEREVALIVKAADRLANLRVSVADDNEEMLVVYKREHPAFRAAAFRPGQCSDLWNEMDEICVSAQCCGYNFRFWHSPDYDLIRCRSRPNAAYHPEVIRHELRGSWKWVTGSAGVLAAIYGLGDDVWSGPDSYADSWTEQQARDYAASRKLDLFAENADDPYSPPNE